MRVPAALRGPVGVAVAVAVLLAVSVIAGPRPVGSPVVGAEDGAEATAGSDVAADTATDVATGPTPSTATPDLRDDATAGDTTPSIPSTPAPPARPAPLAVRIAAIGVDAPIVPVGLEDGGEMEIPERVAEIGWYDPDGLGVVPGTTGTAVLAGHVDSRTQGRGALYDMRDLRTGDTIEVDLDDGTTQRWRITEVIQYPKVDLPLTEIFTWAGPERLALITCGGEFDRTERSYTDNLVVYAEPLGASSA